MNSKLTKQIKLMMTGNYYPSPITNGEFIKKRVLEEFIKNSGMPLGYETINQSIEYLTGKELDGTIDKLLKEGYIEKIDSPASFMFPGKSGDGYKLIMGEDDGSEIIETTDKS